MNCTEQLNYVEIAQTRLNNAESELSKVLEEQEKHLVRKTFQDRKNKVEKRTQG